MTTVAPAQTPQQPTAQTGDVPAQDAFQSRPFAEQPLQPEHTAPDTHTQHTTAQPVGHHFGNIPVFPPTPSVTHDTLGDQATEAMEDATPADHDTGLPSKLKAGVEAMSGFSMNDVTVHYNSAEPSKLMALAYTQGTDIYVGPGQEEHLPHEAWHVVQQKLGQVKPTKQIDGVPINDNPSLEHEAGLVGAKASRQSVSKYISSGYNSYHSIRQATLAGTPPHMQLGSTGATSPVQMVKRNEMGWILQALRDWGLDAGIPNRFLPQLDYQGQVAEQSQLDWWKWLTKIVNTDAPGASSPADLDFDTTLGAMQLRIQRDMKENATKSERNEYIDNQINNIYNNPPISDDENDDTINHLENKDNTDNKQKVKDTDDNKSMDILLEAIYKELASNETGLNTNQDKTVDLIRYLPFVQAYARGNRSDFASISQLADAVFIYLSEQNYWSRLYLTKSFKGMILKGKELWDQDNGDWIKSEEEMTGIGQFSEESNKYALIDDTWVKKKDLLMPIEREIKIIVPKGTKVMDMSSDKEVKTERDEFLFAKYDKNTRKYITRDSSGWRYKVSASDIIMPFFLGNNNKSEEKESRDNIIQSKLHKRAKTISDFRPVSSFIQDPELYDEVKIPKGTRYLTWKDKWKFAKKDMFGRLLNEYKEEYNSDETAFDPKRALSDYIQAKNGDPMWSPEQEWAFIQKAGTKGYENTITVRKEDVKFITDIEFMPVEKSLFDSRQTLFGEYPNKPQLSHIKQTNIGDCYFEAAVASIAYLDPGYIKNTLIKEHEHTVTVNFFDYKHDAKDDKYTYTPRPVTVSKSVPVNMKTQEKHFSGGADWVAIIQKAYQLGEFWKNSDQKEINGDDQTTYDDYVTGIGGGGFSDEVLRTLLGKKFEYKREDYNKGNVEFLKKLLPENDNDSMMLNYNQMIEHASSSQKYTDVTINLWQEIKSSIAMRKPTTVATKIDPFEGISKEKAPTGEIIHGGLVGQHEYTVLQALKVKGIEQDKYWLKLRNPWGNNTGAYTKKKESTIEGIVDLHKDGLIYLDMDYFLKYFSASVK